MECGVLLVSSDTGVGEHFLPSAPVGNADDEIVLGQTEAPEGVDGERDEFGVSGDIGFTDDVGVELEMFAEPATLLFLVPEELRDGEPLNWFFVIPVVCANHPGERRRHFRAERDGTVAFVHEIEKLADDFVAGFLGEEFERFQWRAVVFPKTVPAGDFAPFAEDIPAQGERLRIEIAESGKCVHG